MTHIFIHLGLQLADLFHRPFRQNGEVPGVLGECLGAQAVNRRGQVLDLFECLPELSFPALRSGAEWCDERDGVAPVFAEEPEVAVHSTHLETVMHLCESVYARVSEIHRHIGVKPKKLSNGVQFTAQRYRSQADGIQKFNSAGAGYSFFRNQMANFCEHRFANKRSRGHFRRKLDAPKGDAHLADKARRQSGRCPEWLASSAQVIHVGLICGKIGVGSVSNPAERRAQLAD
jgi:hypothetical protein